MSDEFLMKNLDSALQKRPSYKGEVYRVLEINSEQEMNSFYETFEIGEERAFEEYLSSSTEWGYNDNANVFIKIISTNGKDIRVFNESESEVLFRRDSAFHIVDKMRDGNKVYIIMEETK